ncbi:hypothetical protein ACS0TY_002635 [Phlomoides rotata]
MVQLHIVLFPAMAHGHMIPMIDMAKLFASRGVKTTIIATPAFADPITSARDSGHEIGLTIIDFPPPGSSLPDNIVSFDQMSTPDLIPKFIRALELLQQPTESILQELHPNCVISDMFLPWTADSAAKFGIPRLVFYGMSCISRCVSVQMGLHTPYEKVSSDSDPFIVPNLPHQLMFVRTQVAQFAMKAEENELTNLFRKAREADGRSYGEVFNSFHELEPDYTHHYKNVLGMKAWHIGPLLLSNPHLSQGENKHESLAWLDSKRHNSVVYVCFGSMVTFTPAQLHETAVGLEASGQDFIWVVRRGKNQEDDEDWLPKGFEERIKGIGLIIRGWAPQVMILDHPAIGAFVTHCGWNSTLEGICAGVPMVTWPIFAEQFYNEKLVTEVLGTGVSVGSKKWQRVASEGVGWEAVAKAVERVVAGDEAAKMRSRAKYNKEMARKAVEEGGSSFNALNVLIEELSTYIPSKK